jgi:hypothetical protein
MADVTLKETFIVVGVDGTSSKVWGKNAHVCTLDLNEVILNSYTNFFCLNFDSQYKYYLGGPNNWDGWGSGEGNSDAIGVAVNKFICKSVRELVPELKSFSDSDILKDTVPVQLSKAEQVRLAVLSSSTAGQYIAIQEYTEIKNRDIKAQRAKEKTASDYIKKYNIKIVLVGHSRGAAIIIEIAKQLPVPVYFMGLYDAVNRSASLGFTDTIENVEYVAHAMRNPDVGSRSSFSNTGTKIKGGQLTTKLFDTTHGGIGGDPIPAKEEWAGDQSPFLDDGDILKQSNLLKKNTGTGFGLRTTLASDFGLSSLTSAKDTKRFQEMLRSQSKQAKDWMIQQAASKKLPFKK